MQDLQTVIEKLRHLRAEFSGRLDRIRRDRHHDSGPVSANSKEQAVERGNDDVLTNLEAATEADLRQMDHALQRVEAGLYPICEVCGDRIEMERLRAVPHATICASCVAKAGAAKKATRKTKQPA